MKASKRKAPERGQAILIGVVGLLILAIGMYTSYNLSRTVYEKIKLQNTADATAYALATLEARTFNFIAFTNRAQVANYVQMMEAQSTLSQVTFFEGTAGWNGDFLQATAQLLETASAVPGVIALAAALKIAGKALEEMHDTLQTAIDVLETMKWSQTYLALETGRNQALFAVSSLLALSTLSQLTAGGQTFITANDPTARQNEVSLALNAFNTASFLQAFDLIGSNTYGTGTQSLQARRMMAELANAARFGSATSNFVVARTPVTFLQNIATSLTQLGKVLTNQQVVVRAQGLISKALNQVAAPFYVGTSKLLTGGTALPSLNDTGTHNPEHSDLAQGDALVARDQGPLFLNHRFASLSVMQIDSEHCRYKKPSVGYGTVIRFPPLFAGTDFKCNKPPQDDHRWRPLLGQGGIQPYLSFAAGNGQTDAASLRTFSQPDVVIFLNKDPTQMVPAGAPGDLNFTLEGGAYNAKLDARIGINSVITGMNAMARAQVYYHRPGAWQEPPNFFNPYWGARLAPKSEIISKLTGALEASGQLSQLLGQSVWLH